MGVIEKSIYNKDEYMTTFKLKKSTYFNTHSFRRHAYVSSKPLHTHAIATSSCSYYYGHELEILRKQNIQSVIIFIFDDLFKLCLNSLHLFQKTIETDISSRSSRLKYVTNTIWRIFKYLKDNLKSNHSYKNAGNF